ncbi:alpha/beta hydrolase [Pendulispora brunnea]|uniref:Alpha/beta hydrolase n=1 Tax=Pendulispora brunnea TaxID=2905690 RepID=A0ABZ2JVP8_9BACT
MRLSRLVVHLSVLASLACTSSGPPPATIAPQHGAKHPAVLFQQRPPQAEVEALAKLGIVSRTLDEGDEPSKGLDKLASQPDVDADRMAYVGDRHGVAVLSRVKAAILVVPPFANAAKFGKEDEPFLKDSHVLIFEQFDVRDPSEDMFDKTPDPKVRRVYESMNADVVLRDRREFLQQVFAPAQTEQAKIPGFYMTRLPVAYPLPPPSSFERLPERTYRTVAGQDFRLDVYRSTQVQGPRPAVIFVHGQMHPALVREAKNWRGYQEMAQILASKGYVAVMPNLGASATGYGPNKLFSEVVPVADNLEEAVRYVRANAASLGVDPARVALWVASAGGAYGLGSALGNLEPFTRAVVAYYPLITESTLTATEPPLPAAVIERLSAVRQLRRPRRDGAKIPPVLLVRAGYDWDVLNRGIDDFAKLAADMKAPVTLVRHDRAHHAFDVLDATDETREVLDRTFAFLDAQLR